MIAPVVAPPRPRGDDTAGPHERAAPASGAASSRVPPPPADRRSLLDLLLTRDPKQRLRLAHSGLASLLMLGAVVLMHGMTAAGLNSGRGLWPWTLVSAVGLLGMFALIRSGGSRRFADPSMTIPQLVYSVGCAAVAYSISGRGQGVALLMVALILMFGMFGLTRRQALAIGGYTMLAYAAAMAIAWRADPVVYPAPVQGAHLAMLGVFVAGLLSVSARLGAMRRRLQAQRMDLARAIDRISDLATRDELTGLLNRRAMTELLAAERQRTLRAGHPWSVVILDVDHFKRVNDRHGHAAGDDVLRAVAGACGAAVRKCDSVARWGGEEFVVLLRDTPPGAAWEAAERIRRALEVTPVPIGDSCFGVTASMGLAAHVRGEVTEATLARADAALYAAKAGGRNRVCAAPTPGA